MPAEIEPLYNRQLEDIFEDLVSLSEFSKQSSKVHPALRLGHIAQIRFASAHHPEANSNRSLWSAIMGWASSEAAAMLTSFIPGRSWHAFGWHHPRGVVYSLVFESSRYYQFAQDHMLPARNENIMAVNHNSLLRFREAVGHIVRSQKLTKASIRTLMPIDKDEYYVFVLRQKTAILPKAGDMASISVADQAILASSPFGKSAYSEALTRKLEAACLLGDKTELEATSACLLGQPNDSETIRQVIRLKALAVASLCVGSYEEARRFADHADDLAESERLLHQLSIIRNIDNAITKSRNLEKLWLIGKNSERPRKPSILLASLL